MGKWDKKKESKPWNQDAKDRRDHYYETHKEDLGNKESWLQRENNAECQADDCDNSAVHHDDNRTEEGKSGWCLFHWGGKGD